MDFTRSYNAKTCGLKNVCAATLRILFAAAPVEPDAVCMMEMGRKIKTNIKA
jgi:hypothetical protein